MREEEEQRRQGKC